MIHTIPSPVNLFLQHNRQHHTQVANTWNTDSVLWKITYWNPREVPGISGIKQSGGPVYAASQADPAQVGGTYRQGAGAPAREPK
jgi:hypothetical protein